MNVQPSHRKGGVDIVAEQAIQHAARTLDRRCPSDECAANAWLVRVDQLVFVFLGQRQPRLAAVAVVASAGTGSTQSMAISVCDWAKSFIEE